MSTQRVIDALERLRKKTLDERNVHPEATPDQPHTWSESYLAAIRMHNRTNLDVGQMDFLLTQLRGHDAHADALRGPATPLQRTDPEHRLSLARELCERIIAGSYDPHESVPQIVRHIHAMLRTEAEKG